MFTGDNPLSSLMPAAALGERGGEGRGSEREQGEGRGRGSGPPYSHS